MELPPHRFEEVMLQRISGADANKNSEGHVTLLGVYVDDFIAMSNYIWHSYLEKLSRAMLHGIPAIFPSPKVTGHNGFDPIAEKEWVTVLVYGTSTRISWAGTWTAYNTPYNAHKINAKTYTT